MKRKNTHVGYKQLKCWKAAEELYNLANTSYNKMASQQLIINNKFMDICYNIKMNIEEGYHKHNNTEYLEYLITALTSCQTYRDSMHDLLKSGIINGKVYKKMQALTSAVEDNLNHLMTVLKQKADHNF